MEAMICKELANYSLPVRTIAETIVSMKEEKFNNQGINAWQILKKDPDMLLVLVQFGTFTTDPMDPDLFELLFPGRSQSGKNAAYQLGVFKKEFFAEFINHFSSAIVVDLKKIVERAGMAKE